nr:DUF4157 domain-containing protein [Limobrevibacterium gyesilva]
MALARGKARPAPAKRAPKRAARPPVQAKLEVGPARDRFEQEADRVADRAMRMPDGAAAPAPAIAPLAIQRALLEYPEETASEKRRHPPVPLPGRHRPAPGPEQREEEARKTEGMLPLQRAVDTCKATVTPDEDPHKNGDCGASLVDHVQKKAADGSGPAPTGVQATVEHARAGGGAPLSPETRANMESRLGRDFGGVRVHTGAPAATAARAVGAKAFTVGRDVFFGAGRYRPDTGGGRQLLAHELVHTIQQGGGSARAQPARLQRKTGAEAKAEVKKPAPEAKAPSEIKKDEEVADDPKVFDPGAPTLGRIEAKKIGKKKGTMEVPTLQLPMVAGDLKGTARHTAKDVQGSPGPEFDPIYKTKPFTFKGRTPRSTSHYAYETWVNGMIAKGAVPKIKALIPEVAGARKKSVVTDENGSRVFYLILARQDPGKADFMLIGTQEELADKARLANRADPSHKLVVPSWDKSGKTGKDTYSDADHIQDLQLGGADAFENMWLWQQDANRTAGSQVSGHINSQLTALIKAASGKTKGSKGNKGSFWKPDRAAMKEPDAAEVRESWQIVFRKVEALEGKFSELHWTRSEIEDGDHLQQLRVLTDDELAAEGLLMTKKYKQGTGPSDVHVFTSPAGGARRRLARVKGGKAGELRYRLADRPNGEIYKGFRLNEKDGIDYTIQDSIKEGRVTGTLTGKAFDKVDAVTFGPALSFDIKQSRNLGFGGYVDKKQIQERLSELAEKRAAAIKGSSPFEVVEAGISADGELYADARVTATKALFPGFDFPASIRGDSLFVDVPLPAQRLDLGTIHVPEASLRLGANSAGVFVEGSAILVIDGLGSGRLTATIGKQGPHVLGSFDFDLAFLKDTRASFDYDYATDAFTLKLEQDIRAGALPGVASGHVSVSISRGAPGGMKDGEAAGGGTDTAAPAAAGGLGVGVSGELKLAGALAGAVVQVSWNPEQGVVIAADNIKLPVDKIPGVQNATVSVHARRDPETGEWHVSGAGGADFQIAAVKGTLEVAVDGAAVTIHGHGDFEKGPAKGAVDIVATNMARDADGTPRPDKPADKFTVSGKGAAEVVFGKVLRGAAGLEVTPDARVIVAGEVSLKPHLEVFRKWGDTKRLAHGATPDFPIWGISIAGFGIGVFAFFDANLDLDAFLGPGILENARAGVKFDLEHPEDAVIDGCGDFTVPAGAGLTLDIGGGLKIEVGPAEGKGRVGLDARLGLEAHGGAHVGIHWSRQEGLSVAATVCGVARPQFEVNANASLTVSVDLWLTSVSKTWGPWKEPLGKFGPELEVGFTAPVKWSEANGLDFDINKIDIQRPEIDVADLMKSAFLALV